VHRFFVPPSNIRGSTIIIDDQRELHHLRDVLRLGLGDQVICFDGLGNEYRGTITQDASREFIVQVERQLCKASNELTVWLAPGLLKADRFDWVVQKATELGVSRISPVISRHTVVRPDSKFCEAKVTRWQRIAREAAKQCGRTTIPTIDPPQSFETAVTLLKSVPLILLPTLVVTTIPLRELLTAHTALTQVAIVIGPEGDFSREEIAFAEAHGARPVSLGPLTLRAETAALATIAVLHYALGRFS
jgi:16S rRNA (uracil1498-N3)-methyltransferase